MLNYFFGSKTTVSNPPAPPARPGDVVLPRNNTVYLVIKKGCQTPLGVFDSLNKAKSEGEKATYHNCAIIKLQINEHCRYLNNPVFEN
jgi:hypothetical protein